MPSNFLKIAQQARLWSTNASLPSGQRKLAKNLYELAEILVDPSYGCPSEYLAVDVMYDRLSKTVSADQYSTEGAGTADCPLNHGRHH